MAAAHCPDSLLAKNLAELAALLDVGALSLDHPRFVLQQRGFPARAVDDAAAWLGALHADGWSAAQAGRLVRALATERGRVERARDDIALVWTGPEGPGAENRDAARVLEEMFGAAAESVLLCGYNLRAGRHFDALVQRVRATPSLRVRCFAHVFTEHMPSVADALRAHDASLRALFGPALRARVDFYRPSNAFVQEAMAQRFSLHAKCVVVDTRRVLVTSANFSTAAQERNVEVGVCLDDARLAAQVTAAFDALVARGDMVRHAP